MEFNVVIDRIESLKSVRESIRYYIRYIKILDNLSHIIDFNKVLSRDHDYGILNMFKIQIKSKNEWEEYDKLLDLSKSIFDVVYALNNGYENLFILYDYGLSMFLKNMSYKRKEICKKSLYNRYKILESSKYGTLFL